MELTAVRIRHCLAILVLVATIARPSPGQEPEPAAPAEGQSDERTTFQTHAVWSPRINLNGDVAIAYGIDPSLPGRIDTWRKRGYRVHVMTGVAWGDYADYVTGRWDGKNHEDEAQIKKDGEPIWHGFDKTVFYMSPGPTYGGYLSQGVKRALDAGAEAVCLEEPEFWVDGGWEPNFRRQWKDYYHEDWQPPDSSPDAQYRASKLKYFLYRRALTSVFDFVKRYGKEHGRDIPCYVPTHSLLNYAHWRIVSPESSLLQVGCDGYIAQVWTGTSRTPNVYDGALRERTFETAFLEYGAMQNLVRASGRRVWYLNDPVEDQPNRTWTDYRANWENTLTASLLQPEVWRYEIMPWPERIFNGKYPAADSPDRVGISKAYETELQAVISALGDMKQPQESIKWESCGTQGVGVLVSDTMMFQRGDPNPSDSHLGSFYGLAMPLLKHGVPVEPVQIESATEAGFLDRYKLLLLTYEGQKPPSPQFHSALAQWVRRGGALVVIDDDKDPYNAVHEWWNTAPLSYQTPRQHLFNTLGIRPDAKGLSRVGNGVVLFEAASPAALTYDKSGSDRVRALARNACDAVHLPWTESASLVMRRGPYVVASGLTESIANPSPMVLHGRFIPLFDSALPIVKDVEITAGRRMLLLDLDAMPKGHEGVIAAACRISDVSPPGERMRFKADGIGMSNGVVCVALSRPPNAVRLDGKVVPQAEWSFAEGVLTVRFANAPDARQFEIDH